MYSFASRAAQQADLIENVEPMKTTVLVTKPLTLGASLSAMTLYRFMHLGTACCAIMKIALVTANNITALTSLLFLV